MTGIKTDLPTGTAKCSLSARLPAIAAVAVSLTLAVLLSVRTLNSPDLGYHLAYGDHFWSTGQIVDSSPGIYTLPATTLPPDQRPAPGPGCWYDSQGRYRFPNANWLSQVILSPVYRFGGVAGLCVLQSALVFGIFGLMFLTLRRLGVPRAWSALGLLLAAMTAYERFNLRPEVFGYLIMAAFLFVLVGWKPRWTRVAVLAVLMLVMVNIHSYFLLCLGFTGAFLIEQLLRAIVLRVRQGGLPAKDERSAEAWRNVRCLSIALAIQAAITLVNPWTWRGAILPVQTLLYMKQYGITAAQSQGGHPWTHIGEFFSPFAQWAFSTSKATIAYYVLLGLAVCGFAAALVRLRIAWAFVIAAMALVSMSMRRNIAPAAILITPLALASLWETVQWVIRRLSTTTFATEYTENPEEYRNGAKSQEIPEPGRPPRGACRPSNARMLLSWCASAVIIMLAGYLSYRVVTQKFYTSGRSPTRFGIGLSPIEIPIGPCRWINQHQPKGRIWTDYNSSSNVHYFTSPHAPVPILTNTWAYPPSVMTEVLSVGQCEAPFFDSLVQERFKDSPTIAPGAVSRYGVELALLRSDVPTRPLIQLLAQSTQWSVVYLDALHVIFLRNEGPNRALVARYRLTAHSLDVKEFIARIGGGDPAPASSIELGAMTLHTLGWDDDAIDVMGEVTVRAPGDKKVWNRLGQFLAIRGSTRLGYQNITGGREDIQAAKQSFEKALEMDADYGDARQNLSLATRQLEELRQGRILIPAKQ